MVLRVPVVPIVPKVPSGPPQATGGMTYVVRGIVTTFLVVHGVLSTSGST
jgi:hypothetical protein